MKITICDFCGKELEDNIRRLKIKRTNRHRYSGVEGFYSYNQKFDICDTCYERMVDYVKDHK